MAPHVLKQIIEAADRAITAQDFDALMDFYADDASLVVRPGRIARGKIEILKAFHAISEHFKHGLTVTQGAMQVVEGEDTALVIMETKLDVTEADGTSTSTTRRATYVFRLSPDRKWLCVIDNSYGTDLLDEEHSMP